MISRGRQMPLAFFLISKKSLPIILRTLFFWFWTILLAFQMHVIWHRLHICDLLCALCVHVCVAINVRLCVAKHRGWAIFAYTRVISCMCVCVSVSAVFHIHVNLANMCGWVVFRSRASKSRQWTYNCGRCECERIANTMQNMRSHIRSHVRKTMPFPALDSAGKRQWGHMIGRAGSG